MNKKRTLIIATAGKTIPLTITAVKVGATAIIAIKGSIYQWTTASSANVEKLLNEFKTAGATKAELKVNSGGGDVFEAEEIKILINDTFGKENVTVKVGAVAASAATRFLSEYYSIAKKNSKIMIHKPMGNPSGNEDEIEGQLKLIKSITQDYKTGYATKMSKTDEDIEQMWAKGDYWMNAQEAKDLGLIDEIEDEEEQIDASNRMLLVACGAPNIPEIVNTKTKIKRMELSVLAVQLGLPSTATQADVDAKISQLKAQASTADGLVKAAADKEKLDLTAKKKAILDTAEQEKKITAEQRPHLEGMEVEALTAFLKVQKSVTAISAELNPGANGEQTAEQSKWTFADYQEKNPEAFDKLPEDKQNALIEANYKE